VLPEPLDVGPIEQNRLPLVSAARDGIGIVPAKEGSFAARCHRLNARRQQDQLFKVSAVQGYIPDLSLIHNQG
jgi:hypothetical protein